MIPQIKLAAAIALVLAASLSGQPRRAAEPSDDPMLSPGAFTRIESDLPELERLFVYMRSTLEANKTAFRGRTGLVRGFAAGTVYPQIWLRDAATIIPGSRFFYPLPYLRSWLVEHLGRQDPDGGLQDWVDSRGRIEKNTVETDQETSAVHAAAQITDLIGPGWLDAAVDGRKVLDRLALALDYVWSRRRDSLTGLITGAHTIDWGDVEMEEAGQGATDSGPGTHWTADIYDQAQFHRAARDLARMMRRRGRAAEAAVWEGRASDIRRRTDDSLWQEGPGFYRVHVHLTPLRHAFDEDGMFAMGGNAEAIDSGLASPDKSRRILAAALARQKEHGISTLSGTMLPPYPAGTFQHPMVDEPYEYQNGGQWDWFGGKLVLALFRGGDTAGGETALLEIARKAAANNGLFEWDDPQGHGRGSPRFSGSAGSLARALFEGLYGITLSPAGLLLEPRLNGRNGAVHVYTPAAGRFAAYRLRIDPAAASQTILWNTDWTGRTTVRLAWPAGWKRPRAAGDGRVEAELDGRPASVRIESGTGGSAVLVVEADPGPHTLKAAAGKG